MTYKETVVRGDVSTEHLVQLFDSSESLACAVATFLEEGWRKDETLLVVSTATHWSQIAARLTACGMDVANAIASQQLTITDAATTLDLVMRHGQPDGERFDATVGTLVRHLRSAGRRVRIYGEMVDLLAEIGNFAGAQHVEELWNDLGQRESFTLFCGYSAENFGDARNGAALHLICRSHTHIRSFPSDVLSSFLLESHRQPADSPSL